MRMKDDISEQLHECNARWDLKWIEFLPMQMMNDLKWIAIAWDDMHKERIERETSQAMWFAQDLGKSDYFMMHKRIANEIDELFWWVK